ncbi:FeoC-like transcriptional regulator [Legionella sp.]|uniref:FeoC-like transcriptional regulator n=1 Tax=Legionella sp. TaxID=459 RepID=UPI003CC5E65E
MSTQQLMREFHLDFPALQPMLELWVSKGVIGKCQKKANCQSACFKCGVQSLEYYQYLSS